MCLALRAFSGMKKAAWQEGVSVSWSRYRSWKLPISHLYFPWPLMALRYVCILGERIPGPLNFTLIVLTLNKITCIAAELEVVFLFILLSGMSPFHPTPSPTCPYLFPCPKSDTVLSCVRLFVTLWAIQSMEFARLEYWSG